MLIGRCGVIAGKWVTSHELCDMLEISHEIPWTCPKGRSRVKEYVLGNPWTTA